jgi:hypothetical protein
LDHFWWSRWQTKDLMAHLHGIRDARMTKFGSFDPSRGLERPAIAIAVHTIIFGMTRSFTKRKEQ